MNKFKIQSSTRENPETIHPSEPPKPFTSEPFIPVKQKRYEYLELDCKYEIFTGKLNEFGKEGWGIITIIYKTFSDTYEVYLMREVV